jgi:hypothetical protein
MTKYKKLKHHWFKHCRHYQLIASAKKLSMDKLTKQWCTQKTLTELKQKNITLKEAM